MTTIESFKLNSFELEKLKILESSVIWHWKKVHAIKSKYSVYDIPKHLRSIDEMVEEQKYELASKDIDDIFHCVPIYYKIFIPDISTLLKHKSNTYLYMNFDEFYYRLLNCINNFKDYDFFVIQLKCIFLAYQNSGNAILLRSFVDRYSYFIKIACRFKTYEQKLINEMNEAISNISYSSNMKSHIDVYDKKAQIRKEYLEKIAKISQNELERIQSIDGIIIQ